MSAKYKSPSFLLPNELNTSANTVNNTGINSLYSMSFAGGGGSATLGGLTSTIIQGDLLTISCWYYPTNIGSSDYIIGSGSSNYGPFTLERNAANIRIRWTRSSGTNPVNVTTTDSPMQINLWYHICAIFDTTNSTATDKIQIWINGARNTTGDVSLTGSGFSSTYASTDTWINRFRINSPSVTTNRVDELAFFNKALTSTEIAALYEGTSPNIYPSNLMATNLGPIAYYPLGEQAQNSGYPGNTTPANNVWQFPNGVLQDYVMDFDGSNTEYIDTNFTGLNNASTVTISAWMNIPVFTNLYALGNLQIDNGTYKGISFNPSASIAFVYVNNNTNNPAYFSFNPSNYYSAGNWFNIVFVFDGSQSGTNRLKVYIDKNLVTGTWSGTPLNVLETSTSNFLIGNDGQQASPYFTGQISNVAIWNTAITDANQIANIYNNGSPQTSYTVTPQNWWKLNADSVYTPSAPNYTTSLDFVSSQSDYISFATGSTIARTQNLTFSAWINDRSGNIMGNRSSSNFGVSLYFYYNSLIFQLGDGSNSSFNSSVVANVYNYINNGEWSHVAATWDGTTSKIYINNIEVNSWTPSSTLTISGWNDFCIGKRAGANSEYVNGQISNCAVWDKALSSSQVSTLFNFGTPETNISFDPTAWWKLDDQNAITDSSNNGNTGTNNGATNSPGGVAYVPSWKIPSELPIPTVNYTSALEFNNPNNNEYVDIGTISFLNQAGDFTISQWVNPRNIVGNHHMPIQFNQANMIYLKNNAWQYEFRGGQRQYVPTNGVPVPEEEWIHIALTVEGTVSKFYQNGDLKHTGVVGTTYSANAVRIGNWISVSYPWYGQISNTALFDSALIDSDIDTLYNNGQPEATPSFSPLHWWKLDNTTTGIQDSVGSSNGTLVQTSAPGAQEVATNVYIGNVPVNGVSTTLPSTALQQSDLQFDSPYSNYSLKLDVVSYVDTNFAIPNWTKYAYSIWFKFNGSTISAYDHLIGSLSSNANKDGRAIIGFYGTNLYLNMGDGTNYWYSNNQSAAPLLDGNWHHIVLNVYETGQDIYVDGSLLRTYTYTGSVTTGTPATSNNFINKSGSAYSNNGVDSSVDEHAVFNRLLTTAEILSMYNNGKPNDISALSPSYWWRLGENAYFDNNIFTVPNSIAGAPNGVGSGTVTTILSADAPGTYANGIGDGLAITDRVGNAPLSVANSQSYNMIPDDKVPYVPGYIGAQTTNAFEMTFDGTNYFSLGSSIDLGQTNTISFWVYYPANGFHIVTGDPGISNSYNIFLNNGNSILYRTTTGYNTWNVTPTLNAWTHLVFTKNDTDTYGKLYFNGVKQSIGSGSQNIRYGVTKFNTIGAKPDGTSGFVGKLDEFAAWDKELTADQIKFDLYEPTALVGGVEKTADIENNTNLPTPVAWYRMGD
jgi:hypothetical protein